MILYFVGCVLFSLSPFPDFNPVPRTYASANRNLVQLQWKKKRAIGLMYTIKARNNKVSELAITIMLFFVFQRGKTE
jgi:hypothetical protein